MNDPLSAKVFLLSVLLGTATMMQTAFHWLVAQSPASGNAITEAVPDVANIGAVAAVIWLCWHQTTKAFPKILEDAKAERDAIRAEYFARVAELHEQHHQDTLQLTGAIERLADRIGPGRPAT